VVEDAYGVQLPPWLIARFPESGPDLIVRPRDADRAAIVHVTHRADGTSKVHGWTWAGLAKEIGTWHPNWPQPAYTVPVERQLPPAALIPFFPRPQTLEWSEKIGTPIGNPVADYDYDYDYDYGYDSTREGGA
jgi:hypothetical protein